MKVLWPHNFNPAIAGAGNFMYVFAQALEDVGLYVEPFYLGNLRKVTSLADAQKRVEAVSKNFDITHAQFGSVCAYVCRKASGLRVLSLRGSDWHRYTGCDTKEYLHGVAATSLTRLSIASYHSVVTVSDRIAREVAARYQVSVDKIVDPIDLSLFSPARGDSCDEKVSLAADGGSKVLFTSLAANNPVKRVGLALQAVEIAKRSLGDVRLEVAQGIPYEAMPEFIRGCDMALCTSTHEGWPNSIKEALACGLPFVSTDVSDLKRIADRRGDCVITNCTPQAIATGIVQVLRMQPDKISLSNEVADFDLVHSANRMLDLYVQVKKKHSN